MKAQNRGPQGSKPGQDQGGSKAAEQHPLEQLLGRKVQIITAEGRVFVGILRGIDQPLNAVLEGAVERVFAKDEAVQEDPLGVYVIRGELVCCIGEFDEKADNELQMEGKTAPPFPRLFV